jgi:RND family efflux transporter MFP subunit
MDQIYREEGVPVQIEKITEREFESALSFHAVLSGIEETSSYATVVGEVEDIYVKVGDYVEKDRVVLSFPQDNPSARYLQVKTAYENAKVSFERIEALFKSGGISRQDLDNAKAALDVAAADWDAVRKSLEVKAPIPGYVTKIDVRESDNVESGDKLFTISQIHKMKAKVWVTEKEVVDIRSGQAATALWNDAVLEGKVVQVDMAMDQDTMAFGVVLEFDNPDVILKVGITVDVQIKTHSDPSAVVVERKNILKDGDNYYVFIHKDGVAQKREVLPGRQYGLEVEILEGLKPGEELITEGQLLLDNSSKVKIIL